MSSEFEGIAATLGPVVQHYQAAVDDFDRETARLLGVNTTDQRCLEALVEAGEEGCTPRTIADRLALTTGSVTTMLDRLERSGYILRRPHESDGRRVVVHLTPLARERIWDVIGPHLAASSAAVADRFTPEELAVVERFLDTVTGIQKTHVDALRAREPFDRNS